MASLYSVAGGISINEESVTFGGFFFGHPEYPIRGNCIYARINGQLIDKFGPSEIQGTLTIRSLKFTRKLLDGFTSKYDLQFDVSRGLWMGTHTDANQKEGRVICSTSKVEDIEVITHSGKITEFLRGRISANPKIKIE